MFRTIVVLVVGALLANTLTPTRAVARRKKPHAGIFGTINGKKFSATNKLGVGDPCTLGIYNPSLGLVTFTAIECRGRRRRQGTAIKKNYKILAMSCINYDQSRDQSRDPSVLPIEIPCAGSLYEEAKTGRFGIPLSTTQWTANLDLSDPFHPTSNVRMRIDAFDGTTVHGVIFGVFDQPLSGAASSVPAAIDGEVQFNFPIEVQ